MQLVKFLFLVLIFSVIQVSAHSESSEIRFLGTFVDMESDSVEPVVRMRGTLNFSDTGRESNLEYKFSDSVILTEKAQSDSDGMLKSYEVHDLQEGQWFHLQRENNGIFKLYSRDSSGTKQLVEEFSPSHVVLVSATIGSYISQNWEKLINGERLRVSFFVSEKKDFFTFDISKRTWKKASHKDDLTIKFNPANLLISALVNPLYMAFDPKTRRIRELEGQVLPKIPKDGKLKPLIARASYDVLK